MDKPFSHAQKRLLWHMAEGWQLRKIYKVNGSIHWRLVDTKENQSIRVWPQTVHTLGKTRLQSDGIPHNGCYFTYSLTEDGREDAAQIRRLDFE